MGSVKESSLLPLSLITAVIAVTGLTVGGVYLSSTAGHSKGPEFSYKEVQAVPASQPTPLDQGLPPESDINKVITGLADRQAKAAEKGDRPTAGGKCATYDGFTLCGAMNKRYQELGGVDGVLGRPMSNEVLSQDGHGTRAVFQRGMMFYSPTTGAHEVMGANLIKYALLKFEGGVLGYPTGSEEKQDNGTIQPFEGHTYLTASSKGGVHYIGGRIYEYWQKHGGPSSEFGYPQSDIIDVSAEYQGIGDRAVLFPTGQVIVSSSRTGDIVVEQLPPQQQQQQQLPQQQQEQPQTVEPEQPEAPEEAQPVPNS